MPTARWRDLLPDDRLVACLDAAGPRPAAGNGARESWRTRFAGACAVMFANALRATDTFDDLEIRPSEDRTGRESLADTNDGEHRTISVVGSTLASGPQIVISLKAEGFQREDEIEADIADRVCELQDEARALRDGHPRACFVGVFLMPLDWTAGRTGRSTFARTVGMLRSRCRRADHAHADRLDLLDCSIIGLHVPAHSDRWRRGVVRYFDVFQDPPESGRPMLATTLDLDEVVEKLADTFMGSPFEGIEFAPAERD